MFTSFVRTVIIYFLVFGVLRLMGKRQINDMQPFDLVITLLIADAAAVPLSNSAIPLLYGVIPILTLFLLHRLLAHFSLKSVGVRGLICGKPILIIANGVADEEAMRAANYTLGDLTEQLRLKDVFAVSDADYCILETNGSLSVIPSKNGGSDSPASLLICDGRPAREEIAKAGIGEAELGEIIRNNCGLKLRDCFYAEYSDDGTLTVQSKSKTGGKPEVFRIYGINHV